MPPPAPLAATLPEIRPPVMLNVVDAPANRMPPPADDEFSTKDEFWIVMVDVDAALIPPPPVDERFSSKNVSSMLALDTVLAV